MDPRAFLPSQIPFFSFFFPYCVQLATLVRLGRMADIMTFLGRTHHCDSQLPTTAACYVCEWSRLDLLYDGAGCVPLPFLESWNPCLMVVNHVCARNNTLSITSTPFKR